MEEKDKSISMALVLLSGGQDSSTCLYWALHEFDRVEAVCFNYGQRHATELLVAEEIANSSGVDFKTFDINTLSDVSKNALTNSEIEMDTVGGKDQPPNTLVEGRNLLFLTYAAIFAKQKKIADLVIGVGQTDYSGYPDCRDVFIRSAQATISLALDYTFRIHTPLMWMSKMETWKLADDLGVMHIIENKTLTCYNGIPAAGCGKCPACILRAKGLDEYKARFNTK